MGGFMWWESSDDPNFELHNAAVQAWGGNCDNQVEDVFQANAAKRVSSSASAAEKATPPSSKLSVGAIMSVVGVVGVGMAVAAVAKFSSPTAKVAASSKTGLSAPLDLDLEKEISAL
jgi:hypothetical protein